MSKSEAALAGRSPDGASHGDAPGTKERVTVNLTGKGAEALAKLARTGDSKTDIINRSLSIYEFFEGVIREGGEVYVRKHGSDKPIEVQFL
jgi:hypothetical protein